VHAPIAVQEPPDVVPVPDPQAPLGHVLGVVGEDREQQLVGALRVPDHEGDPHPPGHAVARVHGEPELPQPFGQVHEQAVRLAFRRDGRGVRAPCLGGNEQIRQQGGAGRAQATAVQVGRPEATDHRQAPTAGVDRVDQQRRTVGVAHAAEAVDHAPVRRLAQAQGEDHGVAPHAGGGVEFQHREGLGAVGGEEVPDGGAVGDGGAHRLADAVRVTHGQGKDHEALVGAAQRVVHHEVDHAVHLGLRALHEVRARQREPEALHHVEPHARPRRRRRDGPDNVGVPVLAEERHERRLAHHAVRAERDVREHARQRLDDPERSPGRVERGAAGVTHDHHLARP